MHFLQQILDQLGISDVGPQVLPSNERLRDALDRLPIEERLQVGDQLVGIWLQQPNADFSQLSTFIEQNLPLHGDVASRGEVAAVVRAIEEVSLDVQAGVVARLANTWTQTATRGPHLALALVVTWLEWSLDQHQSDEELRKLISQGRLSAVHPDRQALLLTVALSVLSVTGSRDALIGYRLAMLWLIYIDCEEGKRLLVDLPEVRHTQLFVFAQLSALNSGQVSPLIILADTLRFLGLAVESPQQAVLACPTVPEQPRFLASNGSLQGNLINVICSCLRHLDPERTAHASMQMCTTWLGLSGVRAEEVDQAVWSTVMQRAPFATAHVVDRANIACAMAIAARNLTHISHPLSLCIVDAFLGGDPIDQPRWPPPHLPGLDIVSFIHLLNQRFTVLNWSHPSAWQLLDRLFAHLSRTVVSLPSDRDADVLFSRVRPLLGLPSGVLVADRVQSEFLNDRIRLAACYKLELKLAERIRNLRLLRRLGSRAGAAPAGSTDEVSQTSCAVRPWPKEDEHEYAIMGVLEYQAATTPVVAPRRSTRNVDINLDATHLDSTLDRSLPEDVVYLSTDFVGDGELQWIAVRGTAAESEVLAWGRSLPGAESRLVDAMALFDLECEAALRPPILSGDVRAELAVTLRMLQASQRRREPFDDELVTAAIHRSAAHGRPQLAENLQSLAAVVRRQGWQKQADPIVQRTLSALFAATQVDPYNATDSLRRLDGATSKLIESLEVDLRLSSLYRALSVRQLSGASMHLLVQLQGPIASMPIEWIECGGAPVCERFHSITHVPSVAAWNHLSRVGELRHAGRRLFSGLAISPAERSRMTAMVDLQRVLARAAEANGWDAWFAADQPECSPAVVQKLLRRSDFGFDLAILCGHGAAGHCSGVQLVGGRFEPDDGSLNEVDTLLLIACSVGRLAGGIRDVYGFSTELLSAGVKSVVAAAWPIVASTELSSFASRFVENKLLADRSCFRTSAALNALRRGAEQRATPGWLHALAAFQCYGRG